MMHLTSSDGEIAWLVLPGRPDVPQASRRSARSFYANHLQIFQRGSKAVRNHSWRLDLLKWLAEVAESWELEVVHPLTALFDWTSTVAWTRSS